MVRQVWLLSALVLPFGAETYHAACLAFDSVNKVIYISDPFEKECAHQVASCRSEVVSKWTAFLRKEGLAQTPGATLRCEMYNVRAARRLAPTLARTGSRPHALAAAPSAPGAGCQQRIDQRRRLPGQFIQPAVSQEGR